MRGKKVVIIGDDKQCEPTGKKNDEYEQMILRDLGDSIPSRTCENLVPGKSAFDLFNVVFGGQDRVILLREHFRCVPDIIRYCNKHFYGESLIPLKQGQQGFGSPVQTQFVHGGSATKATHGHGGNWDGKS